MKRSAAAVESLSPEQKKHNKSQQAGLSFLSASDSEIQQWMQPPTFVLAKSHEGLIEGSSCKILSARDGRITFQQRKVAYGYQLVAFNKFGRLAMSGIASSKSQDDTTISHLCGTRNCCEADHIVLEPKSVNDERTHCHFSIAAAKKAKGWEGVRLFFESGACEHVPRCASVSCVQE